MSKVQNLVTFSTSAVFCQTCGMMLRLESHSSTAECRFCKEVTNISSLIDQKVETTKVLN